MMDYPIQMDYTIAILLLILFLMLLGWAYMIGRMDGGLREMEKQRKIWMDSKTAPTADTFVIDEERARQAADRAARQQQAFDDMMTYNPTIAMKGGKPSESND